MTSRATIKISESNDIQLKFILKINRLSVNTK